MQQKLEKDIEQQKKDEELAKRLQEELTNSPSASSSNRVIITRNSPRSVNKTLSAKKAKGPRQMTLEETMASRKRKRDDT